MPECQQWIQEKCTHEPSNIVLLDTPRTSNHRMLPLHLLPAESVHRSYHLQADRCCRRMSRPKIGDDFPSVSLEATTTMLCVLAMSADTSPKTGREGCMIQIRFPSLSISTVPSLTIVIPRVLLFEQHSGLDLFIFPLFRTFGILHNLDEGR